MNLWSLATRSLRYFARSNFAVGAGVAAATAVIVGALVVGDSVRGSLRGLVLDRLGNLQAVLQSRTYFKPELLQPLRDADSKSSANQSTIAPAIILPSATVEAKRDAELLRASQVQVLGVDATFWKSASSQPLKNAPQQLGETGLGEDEVAINAGLATELSIQVGDELTLRFEKNGAVPADNPLGRRDDAAINLPRQKVVAIFDDDSVGGLNLRAAQSVPKNIFVGLASLQSALESDGLINAAWVTSSDKNLSGSDAVDSLNKQLHPSIEDFGLQLDRHRRVFPDSNIDQPTEPASESVIYDYYQLSSKDLILDNETVKAVMASDVKPQRVMAYLANAIYKVDASGEADKTTEVPYSIVAGIEPTDASLKLDDFTSAAIHASSQKPCWINSWLAEQLSAKPGDVLQVNYFEPETVDGREVEVHQSFVVMGIVPI